MSHTFNMECAYCHEKFCQCHPYVTNEETGEEYCDENCKKEDEILQQEQQEEHDKLNEVLK